MDGSLLSELRSVSGHLGEFGAGALVTLCLAAASVPPAMALGILLVLGRTSPVRPLRLLSTAYIELFRNVPGLVLIYFVFFLLPLSGVFLSPFMSAVIALASQHAAFFAEIFRGAIQSLGRRQTEAGRALGLRGLQIMRWVIFPQVLRDALPPLGNEIILLTLNTAVASTIGVAELTQQANTVGETTAATFSVYVVAGLVYLAISSVASGALRWLELSYRVRR